MTFAEAVRSVLNKYADFNGRARRSEYWYWTLAVILGYLVIAILSAVLGKLGTILLVLAVLAVVLPGLAVAVRRLHDTGRSGWWLLLGIVPFGGIVILVFECMDSTPGDNAYGPSPKGVAGVGYGQPGGYGQPPAYGQPPVV